MCDSRDLAKSKIDLVIESLDRLTAKIEELVPLLQKGEGDGEVNAGSLGRGSGKPSPL